MGVYFASFELVDHPVHAIVVDIQVRIVDLLNIPQTDTLDALAREIPDNAAGYFDRVSRIYAAQGNPTEAERFLSFARRAAAKGD